MLSKPSLSWEFRAGRAFPTVEVGKASGNTWADSDGARKVVRWLDPHARLILSESLSVKASVCGFRVEYDQRHSK